MAKKKNSKSKKEVQAEEEVSNEEQMLNEETPEEMPQEEAPQEQAPEEQPHMASAEEILDKPKTEVKAKTKSGEKLPGKYHKFKK